MVISPKYVVSYSFVMVMRLIYGIFLLTTAATGLQSHREPLSIQPGDQPDPERPSSVALPFTQRLCRLTTPDCPRFHNRKDKESLRLYGAKTRSRLLAHFAMPLRLCHLLVVPDLV